MRPTISIARLSHIRPSVNPTLVKASSSQAGPSTHTPAPRRQKQKRLPKSVLRDLVGLHHTAATFMHDPSQLPAAFETAFKSGTPEYIRYDDFHGAARLSTSSEQTLVEYDPTRESSSGRVESVLRSLDVVPTFGYDKGQWSDKGARDIRPDQISERDKQVREALFGTVERGPGEGVKPALEGVEEWLNKEGRTAEEVARDWEERHSEVPTSAPKRDTQ